MKNYVTSATACMAGDCAMASQCSRYQNFVEARKHDTVLQVINTSLLELGDGGCRYLHIAKEVKAARGFKKMYDSIPRGAAVSVWQGFPGGISRRQFYRLLNGEIALLPKDQESILTYFDSLGADTALGFDDYEMVMV